MARKRDLRPGFFKNEYLTALPFETRLLFAGLWTLADREGRLEDRPQRIRLELFPADDVDVDSMLNQLSDAEEPFICRYESEGSRFIQVLAWKRNQSPHPKETPSEIPPRTDLGSTKVNSSREKVVPGDDVEHTQQPLLSVSSFPSFPSGSSEPSGSSGPSLDSDASASVSADADLPPTGPAAFVDSWNQTEGVTKVRGGTLSDERAKKLRARLRKKHWWRDFLEALKMFPLPFVESGESKGWQPDADWILKPGSVARVLEGKYHGQTRNRGDPRGNLAAAERYLARTEGEDSHE